MIWKEVPGFPDFAVSENGDVRRVGATAKRNTNYAVPRDVTQCLSGKTSGNYLRVSLQRPDGKHTDVRVHQVVARAFLGPAPSPTHEVAHNDGNRFNNHYSNLRWATAAENIADKVIHGSHKGVRNRKAKVTPEAVHEIRRLSAEGQSRTRLAVVYGLTPSTVSKIVHGQTWGHV